MKTSSAHQESSAATAPIALPRRAIRGCCNVFSTGEAENPRLKYLSVVGRRLYYTARSCSTRERSDAVNDSTSSAVAPLTRRLVRNWSSVMRPR
jgi:hypothetical protein